MDSIRACKSALSRTKLFVRRLAVFASCVLLGMAVGPLAGGSALAASPARIEFHQHEVERLAEASPDLSKPMAVFAHVFAALDRKITVYPSEGYYYFSFLANGNLIRGNIRFSPQEAEQRQVSFAYFFDDEARNKPMAEQIPEGQMLGAAQGVDLKRTGPFSYTLGFGGRTVAVRIYDAARERASPPILAAGEELVGPALDDSGVRFNLVFNQRSNRFYFLLNSQFGHSEEYEQLDLPETGVRVLIGKRTRFAYVETPGDGRMYLVGVSNSNVVSNSHFDGPFDQLPDYFVDGNHLRDLIVRSNPGLDSLIGPFGFYKTEPDARYAVSPYIQYLFSSQLSRFAACGKQASAIDAFTRCLDETMNPPVAAPGVDSSK